MKHIAIIPARSGSKGVKNKNIKPLNGKPLISHTIQVALSSKVYSDVYVTTDSQDIADIAIADGAIVPFLRTKELASDNALAVDVILDTLNKLEIKNPDKTYFSMLQPTSPLRNVDDCIQTNRILNQDLCNTLISVAECSEHPYKMVRKSKNNIRLNFLDWPIENPPRQTLPDLYIYNGAFYSSRVDLFQNKKTFVHEDTFLYEMPKIRSVNIDDTIDFMLAELLLSSK
tara:strand:+ start:34218 stop:34904 length:687 start_codon:yes stop_codon:yes gene_type:complete